MNLDNLSQEELVALIKSSQLQMKLIRDELDNIKKELNHNPRLCFDASTIPFEQEKTLDQRSKVSGSFLSTN
jgi:DNA gyrase/topoisomerase IV subunit A